MTDRLTLSRSELVEIIERASYSVPEFTRERLRSLAETTPAVVFGWFHCDGVSCPARQIGYRSMAFQTAFDNAMAKHFGLWVQWEGDDIIFDPRVATVLDGPEVTR